jgi:hypothetical protein
MLNIGKRSDEMRKTTVLVLTLSVLLAMLFIGMVSAVGAEEEDAHMYIGMKKCKMCHRDEYKVWEGTAHANAFKTLASEEAKKIAAEKGIDDPAKSDDCLSCHVTGHGVDAKLKDKGFSAEEGVTCEACHGAGEDYISMSVMKDQAAAVAAGLVVPDEKTCKTCHNEKSPTFKGFTYDEYYKKIDHSKKD